jgi:hypothetical protein
MKSFFANLNPRLMAIHFIAFWFFMYGFFILAFLHDYNFLHLTSERTMLLNDKGRFITDKEFIRQSGNFGLLAGYIISWVISTKRNWHWVNSVIIFIPAFVLYNLGYLGWNFVHDFFQTPGKLFRSDSIGYYVTSGLVMLAIGCLIIFSKRLMRYIDRGNPNSIKGNEADRKAAKAKMAK